MVSARTIGFAALGAAGLAGGFALDRAVSDSPYRQQARLPDVARAPADDYSGEPQPSPKGFGTAVAQTLGPIGVAGLGATMATGALMTMDVDRFWSRTPLGIGGIGLAIAGTTFLTGGTVSRLVLG